MKVEYEFNKAKVEALGYTMPRIEATMKRIHAEKSLLCLSDGDILVFADNGNKEDYSNLWINITKLINSGWFLQCATALRWFDENDDEVYEDVLSQAELLIRKRA